jgi:hypothetical protein
LAIGLVLELHGGAKMYIFISSEPKTETVAIDGTDQPGIYAQGVTEAKRQAQERLANLIMQPTEVAISA